MMPVRCVSRRGRAGCRFGILVAFLAVAALPAVENSPRSEKELAALLARFRSVQRHFEAGRELFARGDREEAARRFTRCTAGMAGHAYAHYYLANIHFLGGSHSAALAAIREAESHLDEIVEMGAYARTQSLRDVDEAARSLARYYDTTDSCRERRDLEGVLLAIAGAEEKTLAPADPEQALRRKLTSEYAGLHGNILFQLQRYDEALACYARSIAADPMNGQARNNVIAIHYLAGRFSEADIQLRAAERAGVGEEINLKLQVLVGAAMGRSTVGILEQEYGPAEAGAVRAVRFTANVREGQAGQPPLFANAYIVFDPQSRDAVLIDPGSDDPRIAGFIDDNGLTPRLILNTHGHPDHCGGDAPLARRYGVQIAVLPGDASLVQAEVARRGGVVNLVVPGSAFRAGSIPVRLFATPGHTPGSSCFHIGNWLFSGDSLFPDTVGAIPASAPRKRRAVLSRLVAALGAMVRQLPAETVLLPGHGRSDTLARIRAVNPFLKDG